MRKKPNKVRILETSDAYVRIMRWFFSYPTTKISLNDLSRKLQASKTTVKAVVLLLIGEGFLEKETVGRVWRISCNPEHRFNQTMKIPYNLSLVYESNILDKIHHIIPNPKAVVLFGSYRKGDNTEDSDIDLAVEVAGNEKVKIIELNLQPRFGYRKNVPVNLYVFSRNRVDLNLFSNIANGIVLEGFLEVRP